MNSMGIRRRIQCPGCLILIYLVLVVVSITFRPELLNLWRLFNQRTRHQDGVSRFESDAERCNSPRIQAGCTPSLAEARDWLQEQFSRHHDSPRYNFSEPCPTTDFLSACKDVGCSGQLKSSLRKRLRSLVYKPKFCLSEKEDKSISELGLHVKQNDFIIVSAASSNHFDEMQALFRSLHQIILPKLGSRLSLVLFDLGLSTQERNLTEQKCRCQVLTFPMKLFPEHVKDLHCYSWKPIIVRAMLPRAKQVLLWMDTSIRPSYEFHVLLDKAQKYGLQHYRHGVPISSNTLHQTTKYFEEAHCAFRPYPEYQNGFGAFRSDKFIYKLFLEPWAKCALVPDCMCPVKPVKNVRVCKPMHMYVPANCHRFDQSVMTMISAKLFQNEVYRIVIPKEDMPRLFSIKTEDQAKYYFNLLK